MKNMMTGSFDYNKETYNFEFATDISALNKLIFVDSVVDSLVDANNYNSIIKDLIFDFNIIEIFTNIDTSFVDMKDENDKVINPIILIEHFLEETNVVDIVKANMRDGLLDELNMAVDKSLQYLTGVHSNPLNEALANLFSTLEKKVDGVDLYGAMDMVQKFVGMTGEFTPESIVNAYMNSDVHKKNVEEIAEAKNKK